VFLPATRIGPVSGDGLQSPMAKEELIRRKAVGRETYQRTGSPSSNIERFVAGGDVLKSRNWSAHGADLILRQSLRMEIAIRL